jgi:hypothetical protein
MREKRERRPLFTRACAAAWAAATCLSWSALASAGSPRPAVVVVVEGPRAEAIAAWLEDRLGAPDTLEEERTFRGALRSRGALPLHAAVGNPAQDLRLVACVHAAAGEAEVAGAFLVDLQSTPTATRAHVWSIDTRPGGAVIERDVTLSPSASVLEQTRGILAAAPPGARAVADSTPSVDPAPKSPTPRVPSPETAPEPDRVATIVGDHRPWLAIQAELGVGTRRFSYVDRLTPSLRPYDLAAAPVASVNGAVFPFAFTRDPFLREFGVTGSYAQAFALSSQDSAGNHVDTTWQSFDVGAVERIPITRAFLVSPSVGYGGDDFQFNQSLAGGAAALPSVAYRFVRVGGDLRLSFLSAFAAGLGGSYLALVSTGYTSELFPRQSAGGVEGHVGASYTLAKHCEVSLAASYTRVFYSFNPVPGDADVAGGALDEQARVLAGVSYVM